MSFVDFVGWIFFRPELLATAFVVVGTLFVVLAIGWFLISKRRVLVRDLEPAERFWYSREAAILLTELAPLILSLKEREQSLELELLNMDASRAQEVREAIGRTGSHEMWSTFARASAFVEENPKHAVEKLRCLRPRLQECVRSLDELLYRGLASGTPVERGEGDGGS